MHIAISKNDVGKRIDAIVRATLRDVPLSAVYKYIRQGLVTLNDKRCSPSTRVTTGDAVHISVQQIRTTSTQPMPSHLSYLTPNDRPHHSHRPHSQHPHPHPNAHTHQHSAPLIDPAIILLDNRNYLALNKPSGMPVFGAASLQEQVRHHLAYQLAHDTSLRQWGVVFKPSALHRLDRNTSGVILFAKQIEAAREFAVQQRAQRIAKHYIAIVHGIIKKPTVWKHALKRDHATKKTVKVPKMPHSGAKNAAGAMAADVRPATTVIKPLLWGDNITLIRCTITAGFTHQIRAHASIKQHPLIGDKKYHGYGKHYLLHCYALRCQQLSGAPRAAAPHLVARTPAVPHRTIPRSAVPHDTARTPASPNHTARTPASPHRTIPGSAAPRHTAHLTAKNLHTAHLPATLYAPLTSTAVAMLNDLFIAAQVKQVLQRLYNSQPYQFAG